MAPPAAAAQAQARAAIETLFRADYAKARTDPEARQTLAVTLLEQGRQIKEDPVLRFVALREAFDLAAGAKDTATALRAVAELAKEFAVDARPLRAAALLQAGEPAGPRAARRAFVETALAEVAEALAADDYDTAQRLAALAATVAFKDGPRSLRARTRARVDAIEEQRKEFERVRPALVVLRKQPDDPAANQALGRFRCAVQGHWAQGLPLLARSSDPAWQALARMELAKPSDADRQIALADGLWQLAEAEAGAARLELLRRAYLWYERALPELDGPAHARAQRRAAEALDRVPYLVVGAIRQLEERTKPVAAVVFAPDGRSVYSGGGDRVVRRVDVRTGREVAVFVGHTEEIWSVAVAPDGRRLLSGGKDNTVRLWDVATAKEVRRLEGHTDQVRSVAFAPDGRLAVTGGEDRTVRLWDLETGRQVRRWDGHARSVESVAFSPDGKHVLSASWDRTLRLWDVANGKEVRRFAGHTAGVYRAAFAPDGKQIVSGGGDHTARLWDVASGKEVRVFAGHRGHVITVAFAPDGLRVLTGGGDDDFTVRLWDVDDGGEVQRFTGHSQGVWGVAFAPEGRRVVSCGEDGTVYLWGVPR